MNQGLSSQLPEQQFDCRVTFSLSMFDVNEILFLNLDEIENMPESQRTNRKVIIDFIYQKFLLEDGGVFTNEDSNTELIHKIFEVPYADL